MPAIDGEGLSEDSPIMLILEVETITMVVGSLNCSIKVSDVVLLLLNVLSTFCGELSRRYWTPSDRENSE